MSSKQRIWFTVIHCLCPPGGVPCQAEEGADRRCPGVVSSALQSAQPASQGETEGEGKCFDYFSK